MLNIFSTFKRFKMAVRKRVLITYYPDDWKSQESKTWHLLVDGYLFKTFNFNQIQTKQDFLIHVLMNQKKIFSNKVFSKNLFLIHNHKYF